MNTYFRNLNKIEFVVTDACTGKCKHCSQGAHTDCKGSIDPELAARSVREIAANYSIKTVMTFGGEPLLCPMTVYGIMKAAKEMNIPHRQVITNGYFSKNDDKITEVAKMLAECCVNDLLLSVDAFHQETIPLSYVRKFAAELKKHKVQMRLQPAWLVSREDNNPYNLKTREILDGFSDMDILVGEGNVIFPEGNALVYLKEYFNGIVPENPYVEDPKDVRCISFSANGDVLGGNVYKQCIIDIINSYSP